MKKIILTLLCISIILLLLLTFLHYRYSNPEVLGSGYTPFSKLYCLFYLQNHKDAAEKALPYVINCLSSNDLNFVKREAIKVVTSIGPEASMAVPVLIESINSNKNFSDEFEILKAFASIGSKAAPAIPYIESLINDKRLGHMAIRALGAIGPSAINSVPILKETLIKNDGNHDIREEIIVAIKDITGKTPSLKNDNVLNERASDSVGKEKGNTSSLPRKTIDLGGGVKMEFILVPSGFFMMGGDGNKNEKPVHQVIIKSPFFIGRYEVTQEQWQVVMDNNPSKFKGAKNPVENISWTECQDFIEKLKDKVPGLQIRLPSEAQWEYACRAGTTTEFCFGNYSFSLLGEYVWYKDNSEGKTHPVGEKKSNAWGLYDMHGNVWEWCHDWFGNYPSGLVTDPTGSSSGINRVIRGGSCKFSEWGCSSSYRYGISSDKRWDDLGFRLVILLEEEP